tara:strand:+ start:406 stop:897 length:492 start_codon:yes stop_codon:yes gene_type:complete
MRPINWPHAPPAAESPILMEALYGDYQLYMHRIFLNERRYATENTDVEKFMKYLRSKLSYEIDFIESRNAESWSFSVWKGIKKTLASGSEVMRYESVFESSYDDDTYGDIYFDTEDEIIDGLFDKIKEALNDIWEGEWMFGGWTQGNEPFEIIIQKYGEGLLG